MISSLKLPDSHARPRLWGMDSSDLPVWASKDVGAPHRIGSALIYTRRYTLFALVFCLALHSLCPNILKGEPAKR